MLKHIFLPSLFNGFQSKLFASEGEEGSGNNGGGGSPAKDPPKDEDKEKETRKQLEAERTERERVARENEELRKKIKEREEADAAAERKKLEEEKKYQELAESEKKAREKVEQEKEEHVKKANQRVIETEVRLALVQAGVTDPDVIKLMDLSSVKMEGDKVVGIEDTIKTFKSAKPAFFGKPSTTPSDKGDPDPDDKKKVMDVTTIKDSKEYQNYKRKLISGFRNR